MAAVQHPSAAYPSSPHRRAANGHNIPKSRMAFQPVQPVPPPTAPQLPAKPDPYYGYEYIARLCARFITHLFACPEYPPSTNHAQARLPHFIAYALHRTKLHNSVTFAALVLLQRLKARFPTARGSSGHRLFISAFMIASKVICDDTYSNKSWSIVAQNMFSLREINQMEREMCSYLDWELTVDSPILDNFEMMVKRDFRGQGPFPTYSLQMVSKRAMREATATASNAPTPAPPPNSSTSPIPAFGQQQQPTPSPSAQSARATPTYGTPPRTPDTPSASNSNSTSPASSSSPQTPAGIEDLSVSVQASPALAIRYDTNGKVPPHPLKSKMFAFAMPSVW